MVSLATATEAWAIDHNRYPDAKNIEELIAKIQPTYIKKAPRTDTWGTDFVYVGSFQTYLLISGGPDRKVEPESRKMETAAAKPGNDDIVYRNGHFLQNGPVKP